MNEYQGAMYQKDVLAELSFQAEIWVYGPGYSYYRPNDTLSEVIKKAPFTPDCLLMSHAWLSDKDGEKVNPYEAINFQETNIPKVAILNKEYVNLRQKLDFLTRNRFDLVFSHHHDVAQYQEQTGIEFIFWPFAYDHRLFDSSESTEKPFDLAFSGILQNQNRNAAQTDIRRRIQQLIYVCLHDIPVYKRAAFKKYNIFWNSIPTRQSHFWIAKALRKYRYLNVTAYSKLQLESKMFINTPSPMALVSPRFFENMASRALVFCSEADCYARIFPENCFVTFKNDLSDFEEKMTFYLSHEAERKAVVDRAYTEVSQKHTWQIRVDDLMRKVKSIANC